MPKNAGKVSALTNMPMPTDVKQVRAFMGGINYYRNCLLDLSKRLLPINAFLWKGVKCFYACFGEAGERNLGGAHEPAGPRFP